MASKRAARNRGSGLQETKKHFAEIVAELRKELRQARQLIPVVKRQTLFASTAQRGRLLQILEAKVANIEDAIRAYLPRKKPKAVPAEPLDLRSFEVSWTVTAEVKVDSGVIKTGLDLEWRKSFYNFADDKEVVAHIAYNLMKNRAQLSMLDGWADRPNAAAVLEDEHWHDVECKETPSEQETKSPTRDE